MKSNTMSTRVLSHKTKSPTQDSIFYLLYKYETELTKYTDDIPRIQRFFDGGDIWPDQCEYATQVLNAARKPLDGLNRLLTTTTTIPVEIGLNRYSVLIKLHHVDNEISRAITNIVSYKEICRSDADRKHKKRREIIYKIEQVWESYLAIIAIIESILTQTLTKGSYVC